MTTSRALAPPPFPDPQPPALCPCGSDRRGRSPRGARDRSAVTSFCTAEPQPSSTPPLCVLGNRELSPCLGECSAESPRRRRHGSGRAGGRKGLVANVAPVADVGGLLQKSLGVTALFRDAALFGQGI